MPGRRLASGLILLLLLAALPQPARGHAVLIETTPADGAVLAAPPEAIVLRFNEPVRPIHVQLLHPEAEAPSRRWRARAMRCTRISPSRWRKGPGW